MILVQQIFLTFQIEKEKEKININKKQIDDYLAEIKKSLNINYLELGEYNFHDGEYDEYDDNYDNKSKVATVRNKAIKFN